MGVDEVDDFGKGMLEGPFHSLGKAHRGIYVAHGILKRSGLLGDVPVREYGDHRLGLALGDEVVQNLGRAALGYPGIFVSADAVENVHDRYRVLLFRTLQV